jgi:hypothetical protein
MDQEKKSDGLKEVAKEIVGWEHNKLFITLKYLTTQPGRMITEFCRGEKHKYLSPAVYYFGVEALNSSLISITGLKDFLLKNQIGQLQRRILSLRSLGISNQFSTDKIENIALTPFYSFFLGEIGQKIIALPILLLFTWIFYKKYNHSFKDNSWFALYSAGHASLLSLPALLYWYLTKDFYLWRILSFVIVISYLVWVSKQFFNLKIGKAILFRILIFLTTVLILGTLSVLWYHISLLL